MRARFVICFVTAVGLMSFSALAQGTPAMGDVTVVPPDVGITDAAKNSVSQATYASEVTQKVTAEVQKMASSADDSATVNMVRTWLIAQNPPTATGPYQQGYAAALNAAFINVLGQGNAAVNFRVNAGIIIKYLSGPKEGLCRR